MVSTRKKKNQQKRQRSQLNETLNDFIIRNSTNMGVPENENLEQQASGRLREFEGIIDNASQNQVIGNNTDNMITDAVDSNVIAVENRMHDLIVYSRTLIDEILQKTPKVPPSARLQTG